MKTNQSWILALVGAICCSMSARADLTPVATGGSWDGDFPGTLATVMQNLTGNGSYDVNSAANRVDDSSDQVWTAPNGNGVATMLLTFAGYAPNTTFGIYSLGDPSEKVQIFPGGTGGAVSQSINFDNGTVTVNGNSLYVGTDFGFYIQNTVNDVLWYSVESQNSDGGDHMVTLTTSVDQSLNLNAAGGSGGTVAWDPDSYLLGWEDLPVSGPNTGDFDYQDMVVEISGVAPVPEPTTMVAGGLMLLPFAAQGLRALRRKRAA